MAVFTYTGGVVSMATGSYGSISVRKGSQVIAGNTITTSARSFIEGTPTATLFEPIDRTQQFSRIAHGSGYNSTRFNFNTTEPYNSGAYSTSAYISPTNIIFDGAVTNGVTSSASYDTQTNTGEYWSHAYGYVNSELGTALTVDSDRNVWIVGSTDYCSCSVTSITASLTSTASFAGSNTAPTSGSNDDGYFVIGTFGPSIPFNHNIFGLNSTNVIVHTNSWISFQGLVNPTVTTFSATSPAWANIQIGAGQASCQRVYVGLFGTAPSRTYRVRFEGTNATTGTLGSPNMVWELILYESNPNIFDIQIGAWTPPTTNANGITDGTTYFGTSTFIPTANTGWRFNTGNVTSGASGNNITLVKYSPKGIYHKDSDFNPYTGSDSLAVMSIGRDGSDVGEAIKIGSDGRIYILYTSNSQGYVSGVANNDLGIIKLDPKYLYSASSVNLSTVWNKTFGTTTNDSAQSFDIDLDDNLYITGFTIGSGQGGNDVIAIKVDKTGKVIWKKTYGASTAGDLGNAIRVSPDGNHLYIWGYSGSTPLVGTSSDWFLLKVSSSTGSIVWQKHFNIGATTQGQVFENSVDVDPFGNVYVCGFAAASPQAYFVAKLDLNGNFIWSRNVGAVTSNPDAGTSIRYRKGYLYVGGQDSSTTSIPPNEGYGLGVSKIDPLNGVLISNYVIGGSGTEYAFGIEVDDYGDVYATGVSNSSITGLGSASGVNAFTTKFILDTPQGGFTLSGNANVWNSTYNVKRYTSGKEYFTPETIVFQNDLIATGTQAVFYGNQATYAEVTKESGSGNISSLTTAPYQLEATYDTPETTPSTQLFTITGGNSGGIFVQPFNGSGQLIISNTTSPSNISIKYIANYSYYDSYQIVFEPDIYTRPIQLQLSSPQISTEKFVQKFTYISKLDTGSTALTTEDIQRFVGLSTLYVGSGVASINAITGIGSGAVAYSQTIPPMGVITSIYIFNNGGSGYKQGDVVQIMVAASPTITLPSVGGVTKILINGESTNFKFIEQADESTQLFSISGQHGTRVFVPNWSTSGNIIIHSTAVPKYTQKIFGIPPAEYIAPTQLVFGNEENIRTVSDGTANYRFQKGAFGGTGQITQDSSANKSFAKVEVVLADPILFYYTTNIITKLAMRYAGKNPSTPFGGLDIVFEELEPNAPPREFSFSGGSSTPQNTFKLSGSGQATIGGTVYFTNTEAFNITGNLTTGLESQSKVTFIPAVTAPSLQLFSITGQHGTRVFVPNWISSDGVTISGAATNIKFTSKWIGASPIQYYDPYQVVFGEGENYYTNEYRLDTTAAYRTRNKLSGSGELFAASGASQAALFLPPTTAASTQLFTISGGYTNLQFIEQADESTQLFVIGGGATQPSAKFNWIGSSPIQYYDPYQVIFGEGENYYTNEYRLDTTAAYRTQSKLSGSGELFAASGASQTSLFKPPTDIQLFTISGGYTDLKFIEQADESTQLFAIGGTYSNDKFVSANNVTGNISISGTLVEKQTEVSLEGTGIIIIQRFPEAAVSFGVNPPEDTQLFSISGILGTRIFVPNWNTSGKVEISTSTAVISFKTSWIGSSPIEYFTPSQVAFEDGENFGASEFKYYQYIASNYEFKVPPLEGSGTLFVTSGAAQVESFTAKPPTDIQLFTISGGYTDLKFIEQADEQTTLFTIEGSAYRVIAGEVNGVNLISAYYGSQPSQYLDSYQIVFGAEENIAGEYKNTSTALYKSTEKYDASGQFSVLSGAAQASIFKPPTDIQLFTISGGYTDLKFIEQADESTQLFVISGAASQPVNNFAWNGASSTQTFDAYQIVFGNEENTYSEYRLERTALYKLTNKFDSSGTLFTLLSGATEYIGVNPPEDTYLFTISGGYTDLKFIEQADEATQLFTISGAATDIKFATPYNGASPVEYYSPYEVVFGEGDRFYATEFKYDSTANYEYTPAPLQGSGTIFTVSGAAEAVGVNPPDITTLFELSGTLGTRVFVPNWNTSGTTSISGTAIESRTRGNFTGNSPTEYYSSYQIVFGDDENYGSPDLTTANYSRFSFSPARENGIGTLFSGGLYSNLYAVFRPFDATDSEELFSITGTLGTKVFVPNWNVSGNINTSGSSSYEQTFSWVGSSPIQYYDPYQVVFGEGENYYTNEYRLDTTATYRFQNATFVGSGSVAPDGFFSDLKTSYRPVDATDSDPLFSISGTAGVKLRDFVWVSAVVEYDPYEYIINDEYIIPDFIKIRDNIVWDNTNNIYRSTTTQSLTKDWDATGSITIEGTLGTRVFVPALIASGNVSITGTATDKEIDVPPAGSGSLTTGITGAAEAFGANPPEDTTIFSIASTATESQTDRVSGSGSVFTSGTLVEKRTKIAPAGSGEIFILEGGTTIAQRFFYTPEGGLLFILSGSSETVTYNPPEDTFLFSVSNSATESQTEIIPPGSGSIATLSGGAERVTFNPPEGNQLFDVTGAYSNFQSTIGESGSGTASITGTVVEKHIDAATGSGSVSLTNSAAESQTDITSGSGTYNIDGSADDLYIKGAEQFGGTLFILDGGAERVAFNPPEGNQLFDVSGAYSDFKAGNSYVGSGSATIEGTLGTRVYVPNWIGSGQIAALSGAAENITFNPPEDTYLFGIAGTATDKETNKETGSGSIATLSGGAERVTFNPPEDTQLFIVSGTATESQTDITSGSGSIATLSGAAENITFNPPEDTQLFIISGTATDKETNKETGSGSITSDGFYSDLKVTFNPPEDTQLFNVSGTATESQTDAMSGSGSIATLSGAAENVTFNPPEDTQLFVIAGTATVKQLYGSLIGSGTTTITGTVTESQTDAMSGSGSIATLSGAAENVTFNPPEGNQLFAVSGTLVEKHIDSTSVSGQVFVTGTVTEKHVDKTSGSGSFSVLSGAAEAFGANPPEDTQLFVVDGIATQKHIDVISGSGSITSDGFHSNLKVTFNPPEDTQLFDVTGTYSNFKATKSYAGFGTIDINGTAITSQIYGSLIGSGSIATLSGAAENVTFNPPEGNQLFDVSGAYSDFKAGKSYVGSGEFTITGTAVEKNTESYVGSGTTTLAGTATESQTDIALPGSGNIGTLSGGAESVTFNPPEDTQLFSVDGAYSDFKASKSYVGSGDIFGISGAAQRVTFNPPEDIFLFSFSNSATESQTDIALPGSGNIGTLSGGAESVTFNPPEDTQLFSVDGAYSNFKFIAREIATGSATISGTAIQKHTDVTSGSGTIQASGAASESQTDIALPGSGSLFTASGSAEAFGANPPEGTALFDVAGAYSEFKAVKSYVGSGQFSALSGAVVVVSISEIGIGLFDVNNSASQSTTYKSIDGSGTLFTLSEATESTTANPPEDTALFGISGNAVDRTNFLYYGGNLVILGEGNSIFARALVPQQGSGEVFVDGDSIDKWEKLFRTQGSGSLYGFSGASEITTNVPPRDTYIEGESGLLPDREILFLVYGSSSSRKVITSANTVVINTSGTGIIGTALPERVFVTII